MAEQNWVYLFGPELTEGSAEMADLLGGKGANLAEMSRLGLPVPPGFTIATTACNAYFDGGGRPPPGLLEEVGSALAKVASVIGAGFGDPDNPLLVSVRSGARVSMPGMLDTVLNLGLNDETVEGLAKCSKDERFAWDSYRRFIQMYGNVVLGVDTGRFEGLIDVRRMTRGVGLDADLDADDWRAITRDFRDLIEDETGSPFPQDPNEQLHGAIGAVFDSWHNPRAVTYRKLHDIPGEWGTAVNIQAMVFGNMGSNCATGVFFTRSPVDGVKTTYGEYLVNAQGEDLVAGVRTPLPLSRSDRREQGEATMEELFPRRFEELRDLGDVLERHYRDMQDIEFTIQQDRLWLLQTRSGKRTVRAALKIACDLASEGLIAAEEAVKRIDPRLLEQILHPVLDPNADRETILNGLPASPGAASGRVVLTADEAERLASQGQRTILVRMETSPEDIHGMHAAAGILTGRGGMTSHAAVVARGMGRPCVVGAGELRIDYDRQCLEARGETVSAGEFITIDGSSGEVMKGVIPSMEPDLSQEFERLMAWADDIRETGVRANAETPDDAETAFKLGAEGIGLCRTEHMFFEPGRLLAVREMILAPDDASRRRALDKLLEMQRGDLTEIFRIAAGKPVAIRLLDPPLHEFLPRASEEISRLAEALGSDEEGVRARIVELQEINPMLGLRGCRLALLFPEIAEMQARAVFEAAVTAATPVTPEIMIPLIMGKAELDLLKEKVDETARRVMEETGTDIHYLVGTMIELPSAALRAGEIAETAEFFSFGTNDLTQTTLGLSRDDTANLVRFYTRRDILVADPFVTLDVGGVGELVEMAIDRGRRTRADLKFGLCGEHGGDPESIRFCVETGLDYVSCSPYRVPVARLAAAQAALDRQTRIAAD